MFCKILVRFISWTDIFHVALFVTALRPKQSTVHWVRGGGGGEKIPIRFPVGLKLKNRRNSPPFSDVMHFRRGT